MDSTQREPNSIKKRDEDSYQDEHSPFWAIEKGAVLQEARCFNDVQLSTRKCQQVITKLLYLYNQGQCFTKTEATEVFFSVTKLFHATDGNLRRLLYLIIKEICPSADEVIIVTSSLMKDMNSKVDVYRSNSIRVLCSITDASLLGQIERFLKQAVVDKSAIVSSAALVSGLRLMKINPEIVRRWSSEVQEAASSSDALVQFHAIALLYQIKQNDRLAISKLVSQCVRMNIKSPLAVCSIIRYISEMLSDDTLNESHAFHDFLESCLRHKSEMVVFEAAKNIAALPTVDPRLLQSSMVVLQLLLSSPKIILRFGAIRTLNSIATRNPVAVGVCNTELESIVADPNMAISTAAITTLLRTGTEASVDRLMQQISSLFAGLQDEYKLTVVDSIKSLCSKFVSKHRSFISFLSSTLREEGGFEYKRAIVNCIIHIVHLNADVKELGLLHLSEFIEDCEYTHLSVHILHVIGEEGPTTSDPNKFIRYIYNRLFLENAAIRAAAVSALTCFGTHCPDLRKQLAVLLSRCIHDMDDEVRDRATLFMYWLQAKGTSDIPNIDSLDSLEQALGYYLKTNMAGSFNMHDMREETEKSSLRGVDVPCVETSDIISTYVSALRARPEFASLDNHILSSVVIPLTENETEYKVSCVKHILKEQIIFQFICVNTIEEQVLENVTVSMDALEDLTAHVQEHVIVSLPVLRVHEPSFTYVCFARKSSTPFLGHFACSLHFMAKEIDPISGDPEDVGYEDDYLLEDVHISPIDFVHGVHLPDALGVWETLPINNEISHKFDFGQHLSVGDAVRAFESFSRLSVGHMVEGRVKSQSYMLAGVVDWNEKLLAKVDFVSGGTQDMTIQLTTRGDSLETSKILHAALDDSKH